MKNENSFKAPYATRHAALFHLHDAPCTLRRTNGFALLIHAVQVIDQAIQVRYFQISTVDSLLEKTETIATVGQEAVQHHAIIALGLHRLTVKTNTAGITRLSSGRVESQR